MKRYLIFLFSLVSLSVNGQVFKSSEPLAHTFSIVARDSETGEMAVGVQSHWFSVGTAVSWAKAGVGAIATQSFTNISFGPRGLELLEEGKTAQQTLDILLSDDDGRDFRQVAIVDANGNVAVHTGVKCISEAGMRTGEGYSVQANMMLTDEVWDAMAEDFEKSKGMPLAERVVSALKAAQKAGGDIRGKQSAALLVVSGDKNVKPWEDPQIDLRVDDAEEPLVELDRLLRVYRAYEHMSAGDLALEVNDMDKALSEYGAAQKMFPDNLEMKYWTAVALANNGDLEKALPMFREVFKGDKNWKELTRRLPASGLLQVGEDQLKAILKQ
ncbi:DUF1028 domain-containing protein [Fulvivirga sedimenti]|uniref:DUF1028 domain-containing protein n=1 Tax=Fulvivirga sedimenti TaxID=2879465 RepID=A0A9X1HSZ4_9BACT|nr:DUF1028 domain-containing protein [Fulvivirga sedimenti]MCA6074926.1 DUF1028 domain-containing protein [Fulvivirga sedimenti]MCA6076103.1 DUF1028 domain-containing protein [Fulvivirga sedimenti]MCA6077231.1 DUF1028 domain-containing protein [Fulvivirga sedimenti]